VSLLVEAGETGGHCRRRFLPDRSIEHLPGRVVEITEAVRLKAIGDDRKKQVPGQMARGLSPENALPACAKSPKIETAQMRDLVLDGPFGGAAVTMFLLHRLRPSGLGLRMWAKLWRP
jgi:hypothetical protein